MPGRSASPVLDRPITAVASMASTEAAAVTKDSYAMGGVPFGPVLDRQWAFEPETAFDGGETTSAQLLAATAIAIGGTDPAGDLGTSLVIQGPTDEQFITYAITAVRRRTLINMIELTVEGGTLSGDPWTLAGGRRSESGRIILGDGISAEFKFPLAAASTTVTTSVQRTLWARILELEGVSLGLVGLPSDTTEEVRERADITIRYQSDLDRITSIIDDLGRTWDAVSTRFIMSRRFSTVTCERVLEQLDG